MGREGGGGSFRHSPQGSRSLALPGPRCLPWASLPPAFPTVHQGRCQFPGTDSVWAIRAARCPVLWPWLLKCPVRPAAPPPPPACPLEAHCAVSPRQESSARAIPLLKTLLWLPTARRVRLRLHIWACLALQLYLPLMPDIPDELGHSQAKMMFPVVFYLCWLRLDLLLVPWLWPLHP